MNEKSEMLVTPEERKLLLRLRNLGLGAHLLTIFVGARETPQALWVWGKAAKVEWLEKKH